MTMILSHENEITCSGGVETTLGAVFFSLVGPLHFKAHLEHRIGEMQE